MQESISFVTFVLCILKILPAKVILHQFPWPWPCIRRGYPTTGEEKEEKEGRWRAPEEEGG